MGAERSLRGGVDDLPFPPLPLAHRVGALSGDDPYGQYELIGRRGREDLCAALPTDWAWRGKRVLDLGCGAGRTLRHFVPEAAIAEFMGCDIDGESVTWVQRHLCPPFVCFANGDVPPLPLATESLDLVYAISVFTHLAATWSAWLLEVHRVLRPGGIALLTFMGRGMYELISGQALDEDEVGMVVLKIGQSWDLGGPMVLHSPWWIREHWGRAFDVLALRPDGFAWQAGLGQGIATLRKRAVSCTSVDLERPADDPRELASLRTNLRLVGEEASQVREALRLADQQRTDGARRVAELQRERDELLGLRGRLQAIEGSRSWRLTGPLRALRRMVAGRPTG